MLQTNTNEPVNVDGLLELLVRQANGIGVKIGITLTVSGMQITGTLVGIKDYYSEYATFMGNIFGDEIKQRYMEMGDINYKKLLEEEKQELEKGIPSPASNFIHLIDAKFFVSIILVPTGKGLLWRGKLSHIDGFSIGSLSTGES